MGGRPAILQRGYMSIKTGGVGFPIEQSSVQDMYQNLAVDVGRTLHLLLCVSDRRPVWEAWNIVSGLPGRSGRLLGRAQGALFFELPGGGFFLLGFERSKLAIVLGGDLLQAGDNAAGPSRNQPSDDYVFLQPLQLID